MGDNDKNTYASNTPAQLQTWDVGIRIESKDAEDAARLSAALVAAGHRNTDPDGDGVFELTVSTNATDEAAARRSVIGGPLLLHILNTARFDVTGVVARGATYAEAPAVEDVQVDEPVTEDAPIEEPTPDVPADDETQAEEPAPVTEEPKAEETAPTTEEPPAGTPVSEEDAANAATPRDPDAGDPAPEAPTEEEAPAADAGTTEAPKAEDVTEEAKTPEAPATTEAPKADDKKADKKRRGRGK